MALRMTPSTSIGVSPFAILYAVTPQLAINSVLLPDDEGLPSAEAYVKTMKPKLTVPHQPAMQNSQESAARHGEIHDRTAKQPPFSIGSKVLLFDPVLHFVFAGVARIWSQQKDIISG